MSDKFPGGMITANAPAGFSVAFDGTGDNLTLAPGAAFAFGTGDFTIEQWFYPSITIPTYAYLIDARNSGQTANWATGFNLNNTGVGQFTFFDGVAATAYNEPSASYKQNAWNHCVVVRSGTTFSMFMNGVRVYTTTNSTNFSTSSTLSYIGRGQASGSEFYFTGYMSNVRVVKGTAVYSPSATTLTVPTQLFPITNTSLLTCQSPTIIDNSTNNFTITANGDAKVSNFTPFAGYTGFNPALGAAAGGVWTLDEASYYQNNRQWPIYDPYFKNTTLMLHGNGTNGAQNNTFLDSSTNNFTITRNGNTTQGTFSPFSQTGWSYNGTSGAYCQLNNADYAIGTGDFTIEFWMYCVDDSVSLAFAGLPGAAVLTVSMTSGSSNARQPYLEFGGSGTLFGALNGYLNRWTHIAFVRTSGNIVVYQNGVATGSPVSKSASFPNCANLYLARLPTDTTQDFRGYLSNYRITKAAVYSSNFTPSTVPLSVITNTVLLAFQSNRFVDNSANNSTVTPAGTASVQAFSPFVPTVTTPTTYSNWFDGSGAYLSGASNAALVFGTGTYTVEMWVYQTARSGTQYVLGGGGGFQLAINSSGYIFGGVAGVGDFTAATVAVSLSTWTHIVVVRNSTSAGGVAYYVNGVAAGTATDATNYTTNVTLNIGTTNGNTGVTPISGCLSNLRVLKGTALYTAAFTPPTAPLTNITNTSLLTCQSSTFIDNSSNAFTITATGTTYPVTSPTPFAPKVDQTTLNSAYSTSLIGGSGYFDGTGDYLVTPTSAALSSTLLASDFTIECWLYLTTYPGGGAPIWTNSTSNSDGFSSAYVTSSGTIGLGKVGVNEFLSTATVPKNAWTHFATVRSGATVYVYLNGIQVSSGAASTYLTTSTAKPLQIAQSNQSSPANLTGYIGGYRVVSSALYTQAFVPPITPPTAVTNTQLLLNYTNAGIIDNTAKNVFETVGNAQISTTQSKWGGSSMYFNGSTGYLKPYYPASTNGTNYSFGTGDFTLEFWMYPTSTPANGMIMDGRGSGASGDMWLINWVSGVANWYVAGNLITSSAISANTWTHLAVCKAGGSTRMFLNGVQTGSTYADSKNYTVGNGWPTIGASYNAVDFFAGYLDDIRITKGVARYTTNFTPPTSQLQDQ